MKKIVKAMSVLAALALLGTGFVSCSDDDDDSPKTENNGGSTGGTTGGTGGGTTGGTDGGETPIPVTAKTYDLSSYTDADLVALGSYVDGEAQFYKDSNGNAKNSLKIKALNPAITLSNGLIVFNTSDNQIQVRTESTTDATTKGINYGGQSVGDKNNNGTCPAVGETVELTDKIKVSRYLAIPVTGDATAKFKVTVKYKTTNDKGIKMALVDQDNKLLAVTDEDKSKADATLETPAITKGSITEVRLYLFRTGDATSGGADVTSIAIAPAN